MGGFSGFTEVGRRLQAGHRGRMVNLAVQVERYEFLVAREFATGRDLASGAAVRAAMAWRPDGPDGRATLADLRDGYGENAVLVLLGCTVNRMGTFEARRAAAFGSQRLVLTDGSASVGLPRQRDDGRWAQAIQHARTDSSRRCASRHDLFAAIAAALDEPGTGRAGALVRGWHRSSRRGGVMLFAVPQAYDPESRACLGAGESLQAFAGSAGVFVAGLNTMASGAQCLEEVARLMAAYPDEIVWEVIPRRTYSISGMAAEQAGLGIRSDPSAPYRIAPEGRAAGFLPSIIGFAEKEDGSRWPRVAVPVRMDAAPVPATHLATRHADPGRPLRPAAPQAAIARADPMLADDAPPPAPPDCGGAALPSA